MKKLALLAAVWAVPALAQPQPSLEQRFDALINPADLRGWMRDMAAEPNQVGSAHDKANAEYELKLLQGWGWNAHLETFQVMYPTPISEEITMNGKLPFRATLTEPGIPGDSSATHGAGGLPAYLAFQGDGDVTAPIVYVNYGVKEDYELLARLGVDVRGKIVLARYGGGWRGLKPKLAQEHGAVGCIIYSDPAQDGFSQDDAYPNGPMRPAHGLQRGSVADMTTFPGDPSTLGEAPLPGAKRVPHEQAPTVMKIPALPVSWADAQALLSVMTGPVAPKAWRGALALTYHLGPSFQPVHLAVKSDWSLKTIYDVIAEMPGATRPDQWVLRGNHHDGWVFGASDPLSGQVALLAEAKAIGTLVKQGFKPDRTIIYASWDAEEPGLIGSASWAEAHADDLRKKAVVYINSDENARGILGAGGSGELRHLVNDVASSVTDPETGVSVAARKKAAVLVAAASPGADEDDRAAAEALAHDPHEFLLEALGSGSDFSTFLQHVGVPALDIGYGGEGSGDGVYHSAYDTYEHHSKFVDPGFVYDALLAKTVGHLILREAQAGLPQQKPGDLAADVARYLSEVQKLADHKREEADKRNQLLAAHDYELAADPQHRLAPPPALSPVPFIDFTPLLNASAHLKKAAQAYDDAFAHNAATLRPEDRDRLWGVMLTIDETLSTDTGLPGRPWYRNMIYAPGKFTGYGAKTLPGVREAIEERRWGDANKYAVITAKALDAYSGRLEAATAILKAQY